MRRRPDGATIAVILICIAAVGGIILVIVFGTAQAAAYERECDALGGTVRTTTSSGYGYSMDGKSTPVITTTTDSFCLSDDGRILLP